MVKVETIIANRSSYFSPAEAAAFYGVSRKLEEVVLHHWDAKEKRKSGAIKFRATMQYLLHANGASANDIIGYDEAEGRVRIVTMVKYPNVAFTSGGNKIARGRYINAKSVGIEIDPFIEYPGHKYQASLIEAVAQRCLEYSKIAGKKLPITVHRDYSYTACPGEVPVSIIRARLNVLWAAYKSPKPAPAPVPTPQKPKVTYRALEKRTWLANVDPTKLWNLDFSDWPSAKVVSTYSKGHPIEIVGIADHPLGGQYLMTAYAFGSAANTGVPAHNQGFNKKDLVQAPEVPAEPVEPVELPKPTVPVAAPTDYDKAQDAEIAWLKGTVNSLTALLRDFAGTILNKFK